MHDFGKKKKNRISRTLKFFAGIAKDSRYFFSSSLCVHIAVEYDFR